MLAFAFQVLSPKSDITGSGLVKAAAKVLKKEEAAVLAGEKADVWENPLGLDAMQTSPGPFLHFIFMTFKDYSWCKMCGHLVLSKGSLVRQSRLCFTDRQDFRTPECGRLGVLFKGPRGVVRMQRTSCWLVATLKNKIRCSRTMDYWRLQTWKRTRK